MNTPDWLTRDAIACHPERRLVFEPLRLRQQQATGELILHYTDRAFCPLYECRLAQPADLFTDSVIYIAGQQYTKAIEGDRIRLSLGAQQYLIQFNQAQATAAQFAAAFSGKVVPLDSEQTTFLETVFSCPN